MTKLALPVQNYLLVGSMPLGIRYASDIDIICRESDILCNFNKVDDYLATFDFEGRRVECLLADKQESLQHFLSIYSESCTELLYVMKAGHIYYPHRQWDKHIMDYHLLRQQINPTCPRIKQMVKLHRKSTAQRYGELKTPTLKNVSVDEFFDDAVTKYFHHDFIHYQVAHGEKPMYEYMQSGDGTVYCDKNKWDGFSHLQKIQTVMEECYVIALERIILPKVLKKERYNTVEAFGWSLQRVCTTLTSGWFRAFAVNNYFEVLNTHNHNFAKGFLENNPICLEN